MAEYFLGQIMMVGFSFAQKGFALCNGQVLPINQNAALYSLLGVQYGGNGSQTFQLPDLRGRAAVGAGASVDPQWQPSPYTQGTAFGAEAVTLTAAQIPVHNHPLMGMSTAGNDTFPDGEAFGLAAVNVYAPGQASPVPLGGGPLTAAGVQPHANIQPSSVITMNIALTGIYPSRG